MTGHLHLTAAADPRTARTALRAQSFRAPVHIGKGHWDPAADVLTVHTVNATAGLFAGDAVDWRVRVEAGARLRLVSPSATRVFRHARPGGEISGDDARTDQTFHVGGAGAWLFLIGAAKPALDGWMEDEDGLSKLGSGCWVGASRLEGGAGWMVKVLAADGAVLRRTLGTVRAALRGEK